VNDDELIVVPPILQREIIRQAHEKGHFSIKKTKEIIGKKYFFPKVLSIPVGYAFQADQRLQCFHEDD